MRTWRRCCQLVVAVGAALWVWAAPVLAAVEIQPGQVPAGSQVDVVFLVTQGCEGSPTTALAILLPKEVSGTPLPVPGFGRAVVEGKAVRWTGGNLPAGQQQAFPVRLRLPNTPGATLYFPVVQSCQVGEIRWVEVPVAGQDPQQLKSPAAALRLTAASAPQAQSPPPAPQTQSSPPAAGQPRPPDAPSAGARPEGGVQAGAGGTAGGSLARLLAVVVAGVVGGGWLFARLRREA